ncbi:MAG: restriction endonuclease subunit S [Hominisplanchenecus sp.]|uniref:restriction endonuclease subunit S n=1 Tax=Hominisplanchenecus sp. TaxID=3038130 RepID=UPI00399B1EE2
MIKPKIRFKGYQEEWEQRKLGDLVDRVTRKNQDLVSELPLTISAQYGLIDQNEFFDKRVASKDVSGYYLIENGEFAYNKSTSTDAPWGAIKRLDRYENGVLSTLYIVFGIKENNPVYSDFLVSYYSTNLWHKGIHEIAAEGARNHGLLNIAPADFFETKLKIPQDIEEQKKIGKYFEELERLITLHHRKCEETKILKKYMLQKMFPQNGNSVPEIRFWGFTEDWEQRKLGDMAEFSKGSGYSKGDLIESGTPIILYGRLYTKYETIISDVDTFVEAKDGSVYSKGGEVIVPASGETAEDIARAASVDKSGILLGGDLNVVMPNEDINSAFLAISISNGSLQRELARKAQGKSVVHIHNEEIRNLIVPFPTKAEQNKMENYFAALDHFITLHQKKCDELQNIKKFMLQNMFI